MLPLDGKRHLRFEFLELRAMLAGNVLVSVVDGDLRVTGDYQDNILELHQLPPSDPRTIRGGVSFQITPDAATSINRNAAGVGIVVTGVTRDLDIDMGDGWDDILVAGANGRPLRDLLIDTGSGPDAVSITRFSLTGDIRVSAEDSLDLSLLQTQSADAIVKIDDIQSESNRASAPSSFITIRDSRLNGVAEISSDVPLSVKIHGTIFYHDVCKTPAPPAPFIPCGTVKISSTASLALDMDNTRAAGLFVKIDDIQRESKVEVTAPTSSITIRNSSLRGGANISSDVPLSVKTRGTIFYPDVCKVPAPPAPAPPCGTMNISSGASLSLDMDQTKAAGLFVKIDDIQRESKGDAAAPSSSITIRRSSLRGGANISSNALLAVVIDQTDSLGDMFIKAEGFRNPSDLRNSQLANSIRIVDSVIGSLRIVGSEGRDELEFVRLNVRRRSHIETGGGDDSLAVSDTVFSGFAVLDGGDGTNALILLDTRFRDGSQIVNWR